MFSVISVDIAHFINTFFEAHQAYGWLRLIRPHYYSLFYRTMLQPFLKQIFVLLFQRLSSSKTTKYIKSEYTVVLVEFVQKLQDVMHWLCFTLYSCVHLSVYKTHFSLYMLVKWDSHMKLSIRKWAKCNVYVTVWQVYLSSSPCMPSSTLLRHSSTSLTAFKQSKFTHSLLLPISSFCFRAFKKSIFASLECRISLAGKRLHRMPKVPGSIPDQGRFHWARKRSHALPK